MREIKILTVPFDPRLRIFDDEALSGYLRRRELLRAEPTLFCHEGAWCYAIYLETRLLQGAEQGVMSSVEGAGTRRGGAPGGGSVGGFGGGTGGGHGERAPDVSGGAPYRQGSGGSRQGANRDEARIEAERAVFRRLLGELDEVERVRYDALIAWRRDMAGEDGVPPYVILTNRQCMDLARGAPRTMEGLGRVKGIGTKRLRRHGEMILEVLHGKGVVPRRRVEAGVEDGGGAGVDAGVETGDEAGVEAGVGAGVESSAEAQTRAGFAPLRGLDGHDEVDPRPDGEVPEAASIKPFHPG